MGNTHKTWIKKNIDFLTFDKYVDVYVNSQQIERCYGGNDKYFSEIYQCFSNKDITRVLQDYSYNNDANFDDFKIMNDSLAIVFNVSIASNWLDHSYNHSIFDGFVTLSCKYDLS